MKTVWKFFLDREVEMPTGAKLLHVAEQHGQLCTWAEVDPDAPTEIRRFALVGTGHNVPENVTFVGTILMMGGGILIHVYERSSE